MKDTKSEYHLLKFELSVVVNLKHVLKILWCLYHFLFDLKTISSIIIWSLYLIANFWEKAKSILVGNLNLGLSYLITAVPVQ